MYSFFIFLTYFLVLLSQSYGYFITVDAHAEECFFEKVEAGTKLGLTFQISEGGFLDIDVRIHGPDAKILYEEERQTTGKYTFAAHFPGLYTFCFSNKMSTMTPKVVMFDIVVGETPKHEQQNTKSENPIEDMIKELSGSLTAVKQEQEYMLVRDRIHKAINESTNSKVVLWSIFEALLSVTMSVGQVYYLKRFFEVRRVV